jgi:hypothetical protein
MKSTARYDFAQGQRVYHEHHPEAQSQKEKPPNYQP